MPRRHRDTEIQGTSETINRFPLVRPLLCVVSFSLSGLCVSVANYFEKRLAAKAARAVVAEGSLTAKALADEI